MTDHAKNQRIATNTLLMYIRMFITMCVGLYTSRIVLKSLGFTDYGLYNVIGGVIALFGFVNGAMMNTISRFLTFHIGKNDKMQLARVFSMSCLIQLLIASAVILLGETIGLWILHTKMTIPADRIAAVEWVYQFSIFSTFFMIINVPYSAAIIAHEQMSVYAFISILDALLKLGIAFMLAVSSIDKLVFYAALLCIIQLTDLLIYRLYAIRHFPEASNRSEWNWPLFREMFHFAGWSTIGNLFYVLYTQGINVLLNLFCGPAVNAARGIAVQVDGVVKQFAVNVQTAINPQIVKSYALHEMARMHTLVCASSRYCFYLFLLISMPLMLQAPFILNLWLGNYPEHTVNFIRLTLLNALLDTLINPMFTANLATGKVRIYYLANTLNSVLFIPILYYALKVTRVPEIAFICLIAVNVVGIAIRLVILNKQIGIGFWVYTRNVLLRIVPVALLSYGVTIWMQPHLQDGYIGLIETMLISSIAIVINVTLVGITKEEKLFLLRRLSILH